MMRLQKSVVLVFVLFWFAGCQTNPTKYEFDTVIRPMLMMDAEGKPRQYRIDFKVTETSPEGDRTVTEPKLTTVVGKPAETVTEELHTNKPPSRVKCTVIVKHEEGTKRVDTAVSIVKEGQEVCVMKQSTVFPD